VIDDRKRPIAPPGKFRGIAFLKHPYIKEKKMTHFYSGLMSWMKGESGANDRYRTELMTWARTEYKKDWRFAYDFMLSHNGRAPTYNELNAPIKFKAQKKEVA